MQNKKTNVWSKSIYWFVFAIIIIAIYKALDNFTGVTQWISNFLNVIAPFSIGILIAGLLYIPVKKFESLYKKPNIKQGEVKMQYFVKTIKDKSEIDSVPKAYIDKYVWGDQYTPVSYAQLGLIKELLFPVLFDHKDLHRLDHLKGGKAFAAVKAFAAATDAVAFFNRTGVDNFAVVKAAFRTLHIRT